MTTMTTLKPVIGVTCNYDPQDGLGLQSGVGIAGQDWLYLAGDYVYAVEKAGGIPVLLPRLKAMQELDPLLATLDGVLVTGGHDVDPKNYGTRMIGQCGRIIPERDKMDLYITRYALANKKPFLGICRGIQILTTALGGTLYQDLESEGGYLKHFMGNSPREYSVHKNLVEKDSLLYTILCNDSVEVNSYHHQAVKNPGTKLKVTARSEDGVIEAVELKDAEVFTLGVQWHPEMMFTTQEQQNIFKAFVTAAANQ